MSLWTARTIAAAVSGTCPTDFAVTGLSIDSRTVAPGDLFIALVGPSHDGHDHVATALAAGAAGALVHRIPAGVDAEQIGDRLIVCADTLEALTALGRAGRDRFSGTVIGVTGSVGKTSTKEALAQVLGAYGPTHAAVGSFNNHWGVPLTLARMPQESRFAVIEMGMNHAGELRALTAIARPHHAIVTWIAGAHLEFFKDIGEIADAKAEIFEGVLPGGAAILPADSLYFGRLKAKAQDLGLAIRSFGSDAAATARMTDVGIASDHTTVTARIGDQDVTYTVGAAGQHWASNSLAVMTLVHSLGLDLAQAATALRAVGPPKGRGARSIHPLPGGGTFILIDESYNANPASVGAALRTLGTQSASGTGRRIAILGDMLEMGPSGPTLHADLAQEVLASGIERVYTAGPLMAHLHAALPPAVRALHAADSTALAAQIGQDLSDGDVVMVKGSLGMRMATIVTTLKTLTGSGSTHTHQTG